MSQISVKMIVLTLHSVPNVEKTIMPMYECTEDHILPKCALCSVDLTANYG